MKTLRAKSGSGVSRVATTGLCLALLALGSGCVAWDPIFRGSVHVMRWLAGGG